MKKLSRKDLLFLGLMLFSLFFGAGNLIFPPFLGLITGKSWLIGFSGFILALFVVLLVSFITYLSSKSILKENPAESLRKKMPKVKKNSLNLTTKGFLKNLSFSSKWNIRDMLRNKMRTIMGVVGVASSCMLIVCALGMLNSMNYFIDLQQRAVQRKSFFSTLQTVKEIENLLG